MPPLFATPQLTENKTVPHRTSSSTNIARRFLPAITIPNMPNGRIEAKIGNVPCLSSLVIDEPPPPLCETLIRATVADGVDVLDIGSVVGAVEQVPTERAQH